MNVDISRDPKLSKIDHLYVLLAEPARDASLPAGAGKSAQKAIEDSRFEGRSEESITILAGEPRKITLIGLGKRDALSIRGLRAALYSAAKIARKHRDRSIAVVFPYLLKDHSAFDTTRIVADHLAASDYKYDAYLTEKKDEKREPIDAVLIPHSDVEPKRVRELQTEARAIADGVRTVRDLGNGPGNLITPMRIAERAVEVAKSVGIKATVYDKKAIEKMKMGGLLAVNRGSHEEPRFIVLEYAPRRAKQHVA